MIKTIMLGLITTYLYKVLSLKVVQLKHINFKKQKYIPINNVKVCNLKRY